MWVGVTVCMPGGSESMISGLGAAVSFLSVVSDLFSLWVGGFRSSSNF